MQTQTLSAERRTHLGTKHTRRLREKGKLPAIIYGHGQDPVSIALDTHETSLALSHHVHLLEVDLEGKKESLLVKAVQFDYLGTNPIHIDLLRVDLNERVQVTVNLELRGTAAGEADGGVVQQLINELDIECVVTNIPEIIRVSVSDLGIEDSIAIKDLALPEGVTTEVDPEEKVAICRIPTETPDEEEGAEGEGGNEPELIGRKDEEGE